MLEPSLSLIWSLIGQSPLLCVAHLLEQGLSLIGSLMGQYVSFCCASLLRSYRPILCLGSSQPLCQWSISFRYTKCTWSYILVCN